MPPESAGILFDVGYCVMDETPRLDHALGWLVRALESTPPSPSVADLHGAYLAACRRPDPGEPSLLVQMLRSLGVPAEPTAALRRAVPWDAVPLVAYPEAVAALRDLRDAGFRLGILANQPRSTRVDLDRAGITALCESVCAVGGRRACEARSCLLSLALEGLGPPRGPRRLRRRPPGQRRRAREGARPHHRAPPPGAACGASAADRRGAARHRGPGPRRRCSPARGVASQPGRRLIDTAPAARAYRRGGAAARAVSAR